MPAANRWVSRLFAVAAAGLMLLLALPAEALTVRPTHPRIFYQADSMAVIRARCTGANSSLYTPYKIWVDQCVGNTGRHTQKYVHHYALMYLLTGQSQYGNLAVSVSMRMVRNNEQLSGEGMGPAAISTLALAYDWAYPAFTPAQRDTIVQAFLGHLNHDPDGSGHPWLYWDITWGYAYAIANDAGTSNSFVLNKLSESIAVLNETRSCLDVLAPNGAIDGYGATRAFKMWALWDCLKLGTDYSAPPGAFIANSPNFWLARFRPDFHWARMPAKYNIKESIPLRFFSFFSARLDNQVAGSVARTLVQTGRWDDDDALPDAAISLAWYHGNRITRPLSQADLDYYDSGMGVVLARSGYNLSDTSTDVTVGFFNGPDTQNHKTQNHFFITRGTDNMIVDSGSYQHDIDDHYISYYSRAIAHNTTLIYDPTESFGDYTNYWGADRIMPNDGGQGDSDEAMGMSRWPTCDGARGYRGEITQYEETPDYVLAVGDATKAYSSSKVTKVLRRFLYLRPNWVLVQDQITLARPHLPVRAIFHTIGRPVTDTPLQVVEGNLNTGGIFRSSTARRIQVERGTSSARIYVLQAEGGTAEVQVLGGSGSNGMPWRQGIEPHDTITYDPSHESYEFQIDGTNFVPGGPYMSQSDIDNRNAGPASTAGDWRTEVVVNNATTEVRIACLIHITPAGAPLATVTPTVNGDVLSVAVQEGGTASTWRCVLRAWSATRWCITARLSINGNRSSLLLFHGSGGFRLDCDRRAKGFPKGGRMRVSKRAGHPDAAEVGRQVGLIRGINVGRAKRVAMADLRALVEGLGYSDVRTLLNSGNIVYRAPNVPAGTAAARIEKGLAAELGVSARVIAITAAELDGIVAGNRLLKVATDPTRLLVSVLGNPSDRLKLKPLAQQDWAPEALLIGSRAVYVWCPAGLLASRLFESVSRVLGDAVTTRNWATLTKLHAMVRGPSTSRRVQ